MNLKIFIKLQRLKFVCFWEDLTHLSFIIEKLIYQLMQNKDKVLDFYYSGRYECDLDFHLYLRDILLEMNIYQWDQMIEKQINTLNKIRELTQINSKSLEEDYDDEQGICQTYKIKSLINQLCSKQISNIINECEQLKWQPYSSKIKMILNAQLQYQSILQRIQVTVHSQQFRIDSMLFTTFFYQIHGKALDESIQLYSNAIEYYLNYLNLKKVIFDTLIEASEYSNVLKLQKTKEFVGTLFFILKYCLRFCEIIKILTGKNNLSLKFTVIKKQIEKTVKRYPEWKSLQQKEELFGVLQMYKQHLKIGNELQRDRFCRWCFKGMREASREHYFCSFLIYKKELFV